MSTKFQYYIADDDGEQSIYGIYWHSQTFTPSIAHGILSVKLLLFRLGSPGTVTVSIRATSGGHPTGADLCSGTTDGDTLATASPYEWREITFTTSTDLTASTKYAIVVRATGGNISNALKWRRDESSPTYAGGNQEYSSDSGVVWASNTANDFIFEEWGGYNPTVITLPPVDVVGTATTGQGHITSLGSPASVTAHGVCWNTTGAPTTSDSSTDKGAASAVGVFTTHITGLTKGTLYYLRAYATNSYGTAYGAQVSFTAVAGEQKGLFAVVETRLHYLDAYGTERYLEGTAV